MERLPANIYVKKYNALNKHLPKAYYERDYDNLVFVAVLQDNLEGLRAILATGRSVNIISPLGDTPLTLAVKHNSYNVARLLIGRHADASIADGNAMTPMMIAQQNHNYVMMHLLDAAQEPMHQASNITYVH